MISHFIHLLLSMWFLLLVSTLHTLVVATSDKPQTSFAVVKNNLLLTEYAWIWIHYESPLMYNTSLEEIKSCVRHWLWSWYEIFDGYSIVKKTSSLFHLLSFYWQICSWRQLFCMHGNWTDTSLLAKIMRFSRAWRFQKTIKYPLWESVARGRYLEWETRVLMR